MAIFALVIGSTIGMFIGLFSFVFLDFSFLASFGIYQVAGVVLTFLIVLWNSFAGSDGLSVRPSVHVVSA